MNPSPVPVLLLVDDDPLRLEAWRQVFSVPGVEGIMAQPPAEALRLFGKRMPAWVFLAPTCARGRGRTLYAELRRHPYAARARFVLVGESLPGHDGPVWPASVDGAQVRERVEALLRGSADGGDGVLPRDEVAAGGGLDLPTREWPDREAPFRGPGQGDVPKASPPTAGAAGDDASGTAHASLPGVSATGEGNPGHGAGDSRTRSAGPLDARETGGGLPPSVLPLPPTLGPGASEEGGHAFCRRLLRWAAEPGGRRVSLGEGDGPVRTLWLWRGRVVRAESSVPAESLLERALLDGLITAGERAALDGLRRAGPAEQLAALRARGWVREEEAGPLVLRSMHAVALVALDAGQVRFSSSEEASTLAEGPGMGAVVLEALRRRARPEAWLEQAGGRQARVRPVAHHVQLDLLGLTERELAWVRSWQVAGGTVEALLLGAGLRELSALTLLEALQALDVVAVQPPARTAPATLGQREIVRLQAKLAGLERADYFEVLGLQRDAGTPEVLRAWEQLRAEFEPLRYVGHPDTGLVHDAQAVCAVLDEAARALRDDALRAAYARYLVG